MDEATTSEEAEGEVLTVPSISVSAPSSNSGGASAHSMSVSGSMSGRAPPSMSGSAGSGSILISVNMSNEAIPSSRSGVAHGAGDGEGATAQLRHVPQYIISSPLINACSPGYQRITDEQSCRAAADAVGLFFVYRSVLQRPLSCYERWSYVWFTALPTVVSGPFSDPAILCKWAATDGEGERNVSNIMTSSMSGGAPSSIPGVASAVPVWEAVGTSVGAPSSVSGAATLGSSPGAGTHGEGERARGDMTPLLPQAPEYAISRLNGNACDQGYHPIADWAVCRHAANALGLRLLDLSAPEDPPTHPTSGPSICYKRWWYVWFNQWPRRLSSTQLSGPSVLCRRAVVSREGEGEGEGQREVSILPSISGATLRSMAGGLSTSSMSGAGRQGAREGEGEAQGERAEEREETVVTLPQSPEYVLSTPRGNVCPHRYQRIGDAASCRIAARLLGLSFVQRDDWAGHPVIIPPGPPTCYEMWSFVWFRELPGDILATLPNASVLCKQATNEEGEGGQLRLTSSISTTLPPSMPTEQRSGMRVGVETSSGGVHSSMPVGRTTSWMLEGGRHGEDETEGEETELLLPQAPEYIISSPATNVCAPGYWPIVDALSCEAASDALGLRLIYIDEYASIRQQASCYVRLSYVWFRAFPDDTDSRLPNPALLCKQAATDGAGVEEGEAEGETLVPLPEEQEYITSSSTTNGCDQGYLPITDEPTCRAAAEALELFVIYSDPIGGGPVTCYKRWSYAWFRALPQEGRQLPLTLLCRQATTNGEGQGEEEGTPMPALQATTNGEGQGEGAETTAQALQADARAIGYVITNAHDNLCARGSQPLVSIASCRIAAHELGLNWHGVVWYGPSRPAGCFQEVDDPFRGVWYHLDAGLGDSRYEMICRHTGINITRGDRVRVIENVTGTARNRWTEEGEHTFRLFKDDFGIVDSVSITGRVVVILDKDVGLEVSVNHSYILEDDPPLREAGEDTDSQIQDVLKNFPRVEDMAAFKCPITKQIFRVPVVASDGRTYENSSLQEASNGLEPSVQNYEINALLKALTENFEVHHKAAIAEASFTRVGYGLCVDHGNWLSSQQISASSLLDCKTKCADYKPCHAISYMGIQGRHGHFCQLFNRTFTEANYSTTSGPAPECWNKEATIYNITYQLLGEDPPALGIANTAAFRCPISQDFFRDPVVASDGHTYERKYIEDLLRRNGNLSISPMDRRPLSRDFADLFPNRLMKSLLSVLITRADLIQATSHVQETGAGPSTLSLRA